MIAGFPFIASSLDSDARAYCQASGATDRAALNYFVKGIKRLGLWDDMVCWPLRSAQNAGTGSTAYSLGGLGTYNGTLVNGPTWGVDGIEFATNPTTGRNRHISVAWSTAGGYDIRSNSSVVCVSNFGEIIGAGANIDQFLFGGGATANGRCGGTNTRSQDTSPGTTILGPTNIGNVNYATQSSQALASDTWRMWTTQRENNEIANNNAQGNRHFRDTTQIANGSNAAQVGFESIPNASEVLILGNTRGNTSLAPVGKMAFIAVIGNWQVDVPSFRSLYASTLGAALLP